MDLFIYILFPNQEVTRHAMLDKLLFFGCVYGWVELG